MKPIDSSLILAEADELAAHLWRIPAEDHPAYKRAINRLLSLVTGVLAGAFLFVSALPAQQTVAKRDSAIADTLARMRPYLSTGRDRNKADSLARVLRQPMPATRVDTVSVHVYDQVEIRQDRTVRLDTLARGDTVRITTTAVSRVLVLLRDTVRYARADTTTSVAVIIKPPTVPPPIIVPPPADTSAVFRIAGPYITAAQQVAMGQPFAEYDAQFARYDDPAWPSLAARFGPDVYNYYDRASAYYVRWRQTGDAKYKVRGDSAARDFRKRYVEANAYLITSWEGFAEGMAIHYAVNGDTASRTAVGKMGDYFQWFTTASSSVDERIKAYLLRTQIVAWQIKAPSVGLGAPSGIPAAGDWATVLRANLTKILATQRADGGWPGGPCGGMDHPFTAGLLMDALVRYHEKFEPDPRILPAVKRSADYLWATRWLTAANAFQYIGGVCEGEGGPGPAPILNGLIVNAYGWVYKMTGDATYKTRATAMIAGTVASGEAALDNPKMWNQQHGAAFRALAWVAR
jgi:hypothetical protein